MLICVIERTIYTERFDTYEEAYDNMEKQFESYGGNNEKIESLEASLEKLSAWITEGNNHDNYDWEIIDLKLD